MFGKARSALDAGTPWWVALAAAALLVGGWVYTVDRPAGSVWLLPAGWGRTAGAVRAFGSIGDWLPSFVHAFAFTLLTAACLPATRSTRRGAALLWWLVDSAFELGQHRRWSAAVAAALPEGWRRLPVLDHVGPYLQHGTFDVADLAAIAAGCIAAFALLGAVSAGRRRQARASFMTERRRPEEAGT